MAGGDPRPPLLQLHKRKTADTAVVTEANAAIVKNWCFHVSDLVVSSPFERDSRMVKDKDGNKVMDGDTVQREPVYLRKKSVSWLYYQFKQPVEQGGCEIARDDNGNVVIGHSSFEKLLPGNLRPMTKTHRLICGCKEHQNMHFKHKALLENRIARRDHFQHLIDNEYPEATHPREHAAAIRNRDLFVAAAFTPEGEHIWPTATDAYLQISCDPVGPENWMLPYKCTLGQCDKCCNYGLPLAPGEGIMSTANDKNVVRYKENCVEYNCDEHGFIASGKSVCPKCVALKIPRKKRKVKGKERCVWKSYPIGEFMKDHYPKQLRSYSNHRFLCHALGKQGCLGDREKCVTDNPGNVLVHRDYTTRQSMEFNDVTQSAGMGGHPTVGLEAMTVRFKGGEEGNLLHWIAYLSDEQQQDSRTSFRNSQKMLRRLTNTLGLLQPDTGQTGFFVSDGCGKQYKCANSVMTLVWLSLAFEIPLDVLVTAPYHGKSLVDALAGVDKALINRLLNDKDALDNATRKFGKLVSHAQLVYPHLASEDRKHGSVADTKHKHHKDDGRVHDRHYEVTAYNDKSPIPFKNTTFDIKPSQWGKAKETKNKQREHFNFRFHPDMPLNTFAARRIGCYCLVPGGCKEQLEKPWDLGKTAKTQECFKTAPNCRIGPMMGDLNDWKLIRIDMKSQSNRAKKEVNAILQWIMSIHVKKMQQEIKKDNIGAVSLVNVKGYHLVQWTDSPFQLAEEAKDYLANPMPAGTWVCRGHIFSPIELAPGWFGKARPAVGDLYSLEHVLSADVETETFCNSEDESLRRVPPRCAYNHYRRYDRQDLKFAPLNVENILLRKKNRLAKMKLLEVLDDDEVEAEAEREQERLKRQEKAKEAKKKKRVRSEGFVDLEEEEKEEEEEEEDDEDIEIEEEEGEWNSDSEEEPEYSDEEEE